VLSFATSGVFHAFPVKFSAGHKLPLGKIAFSSLSSFLDACPIQLVVINANETIADIKNAFIYLVYFVTMVDFVAHDPLIFTVLLTLPPFKWYFVSVIS